VDLAAHLICC
jgi:hypothetical protein